MSRPRRPALTARTTAMALVLMAHALVMLPFLLGQAVSRRPAPPAPYFISLWPMMVPPEQVAETSPEPAVAPQRVVTRAAPVVPVAPSQAITPEPAAAQDQPAEAAQESGDSPARGVDWSAAATSAAARFAERRDAPESFSPPPKVLRESCTPRVIDEETARLVAGVAPDVPDPPSVGPSPAANCVIVGGRPQCVSPFGVGIALGRRAQAAGDLFDNMHEKRKSSSVPDVHYCD